MPLIKNKFLYILLLLFFSGINLGAAEITFVNAMPIYLYGSVSSFATVYEFIGAVVTDPTVHVIFALGVTIQVFLTGMRARTGDVSDIGKSLLAPITLYALFFVPTVNVHITDLRIDKGLINYSVPDGGYRKVDNIPYAIAFIPASSSLLVSLFIDLIDDNWNSVNLGSKFSSLGFQEMSRISQRALILAQLEDVNISNVTVYNMNQYVSVCLVTEALKTSTNRQKLIHPSKTFPEMYNPANFDGNVSTTTVTLNLADNLVFNDTCANFYTDYVSGVATEIEDGMETLLSQNFPNVDVSSANFNDAWREQSGVEQSIVGNIRVAMATTAASRALERTLSIEGIGVDGVSMATEIGIETTIANLRTEGLAKFEWLSRMLPDAINIILMIILGAFPLMIMVMSFFGKDAGAGITKYFMGYIAMNFNLVSLALVSNIISYYTAQNAQQAIVSYAGMPFGLTQVSDFMFQQADMAGLAGLIGAVSVFAVTPLIFMGETAGFSAAVGAVGSAFRGNVVSGAKDALVEKDSQAAIDAQALEAKNERDAAAWLNQEGYQKPSNMNAVEAQNQIMKNLGAIGSANSGAEIFHSGNAQNFMSGSQAQSSQAMNKTAGMGASVDMASAGSVAFEDGEVMGSMVNNTARLRNESESYNPSDVGGGQAIAQFGKDMGSAALSKEDPNANATVANATNAVANQVGAGRGLLETGAFNNDGTLAGNDKTDALIKGAALSSAQKASEQIGAGATGDMQDFLDKGLMDGSRNANATNQASQIMKNGVDADGKALYDEDRAAQGQAIQEVAAHNKNMQTADATNFGKTGEVTGVADFITGVGAQARISANEVIPIGEEWQKMDESEKIAMMSKVKENAQRKTFGAIEAANVDLHTGVDKDGETFNRDVDQAIKDDVTVAKEKAIATSSHASNLVETFGNDLEGEKIVKGKAQTIAEDLMNNGASYTPEKREELQKELSEAIASGDTNRSTTLAKATSNIDQSKIDSLAGQALGIQTNNDVGVDYAQNAMYGEMSKQQSTQAKLDAQGGVDGAVGIDVMEAGQKASAQKGAVEGLQSEAQKIGEEIGKSAAKVMEDTAKAMASAKIAVDSTTIGEYDSHSDFVGAQKRDAIDKATKSKVMDEMANNSDAKNNVIEEEKRQIEATKGETGVADYLREGKEMGFLDKNGKASENADDWVRGRSTFSASGMNKNEQGVIAGARVSTAFNALTGEAITNVDGVRKIEDGTSTNAHLGDSGNIESQRTREGYEHMMNPMSKGLPMLVGKSHDAAQEYFQSHGMSEDNAGSMASIVTAGGAAVTAAGIVEAGTRIKNSVMGNRVATKSFEYDTGKVNADGAIMKSVEKGEHFSTKNNSALGDYVKNNDVSKVERGIPGKVWETMFNKTKLPSSQDSMPNESTNVSDSTQNQSTDNSGNNKTDNKVQHNNPSNINSTDSITQSGKTSKSSQSRIMESLDAKSLENEKLAINGDMSDGEWVKKEMALDDVKQQVASGKVHSKQLKEVGLNPKDLQLEIGEKGFVDMEATDAKHQKVQTKLDNIKTNAPSTDIPKKLSIAEEIGAEHRKQTQLNANGAYNADYARLKDTHAEQIRLNGGVATPEMAHRQAMEVGAMQDSHFDRLNQNKLTPVSNLLDNKGTSQGSWMSNLFKSMTSSSTPPIEMPTVSGGGKIKAIATLAALSTAGTVIASDDGVVGDVAKSVFKQSSTDSTLKNAVNAADASAEILDPTIAGYKTVKETATSVSNNIDSGNYLEAAKDVVKTPANFAKNVLNDGFQMGQSMHSLYDKVTYDSPVLSKEKPIPQHIQNAFSTSPMHNSVSAMRNAYSDNTSNVNSTPGEYLANDTSDMTRNLEDISMTSEFNQETSEGIREAVEKLSNPQNNNNGGI